MVPTQQAASSEVHDVGAGPCSWGDLTSQRLALARVPALILVLTLLRLARCCGYCCDCLALPLLYLCSVAPLPHTAAFVVSILLRIVSSFSALGFELDRENIEPMSWTLFLSD
jgi:hypothetical protein